MKVDGSLRSLIQGVSQQPARNRLPGQCTAQDNMSSNPVTGLTRRPPMEEIAALFEETDDVQFYDFDLGEGNQFVLAATPGELRAFGMDGDEKVVTDIDLATATVTITIATPAVISWTTHGRKAGDIVVFTTDGALPTGIVAGTKYYVSSAGLAAGTFRIAPTKADALAGTGTINTTGTQSGTHTGTSKFNYLDGGDLAFTTLDDITYIANRSTVVTMDTATKGYVETGSLVYLLGGQYGRVYRINVEWSGATVTVTYTAPDGGSAVHSTQITTEYIATQLETALNASGTFTGSFSVTRVSDVLYIKKTASPTTEPFKVTVADGDGGVYMLVVNNTIKNANSLPRYAPHGYVVTIKGTETDTADDWYVEFVAEKDDAGALPALGDGFGRNGIWAECVAPANKYKFDLTTMPHILEYDFDLDEFDFGRGLWEDKAAGDEDSNASPTFVDRTIEDLAYFQGRLVVLSGPATIMSRNNNALNFWLNSATILGDNDRIDVQSTAKGVRKMLKAIPHNRDLVIFANKGQFIIFGRNAITPRNAAMVLSTDFEADMTASPVGAGKNIFFAFKFGSFTGVQEFHTQDGVDADDARPITQHVNKYLEGNVQTMTSTSNFNILLVQTTIGQDVIYLYEYTWIDDRKVQSSWSRWIMADPVVYSFITESVVSLITKRDNNYILNKIDLDVQTDTGLSYNVRLDRKIYIPAVDFTVAAPYDVPVDDPEDIIFIQGEGCPTPGLVAWVDDYDAGTDTYTFDRDMEGGTVIAGIRYRSSYIPTNPDVKDSDGVVIGTGKLKVSKFLVNCQNTGKLFARVFSDYFSDRVMEFTGLFVGDPGGAVGEAAISDTTYIVPFRENVDNAEVEYYSESHLPFTLTDIQWNGQYTKKGKRVTGGSRQ